MLTVFLTTVIDPSHSSGWRFKSRVAFIRGNLNGNQLSANRSQRSENGKQYYDTFSYSVISTI